VILELEQAVKAITSIHVIIFFIIIGLIYKRAPLLPATELTII
jgi:hypothetical protein